MAGAEGEVRSDAIETVVFPGVSRFRRRTGVGEGIALGYPTILGRLRLFRYPQ